MVAGNWASYFSKTYKTMANVLCRFRRVYIVCVYLTDTTRTQIVQA